VFFLAIHPESGDEIPGTGGVRKLRFGFRGRGKSGGARVIYYYFDKDNPLYALLIYGKNEQVNLRRNRSARSDRWLNPSKPAPGLGGNDEACINKANERGW